MRVRVKICGITTVDDGIGAARAGADAIGMVFYPPSARAVDPLVASAVAAALPPFVSRVGVFVDPEASRVREILDRVKLDALQFHGEESPEFCEAFELPYVKAVAVRADLDMNLVRDRYRSAAALLLDTYHPSEKGGTGRTFDWSCWPREQRAEQPLVLAGGLNPDNVAAAIAATEPYAVDVSGGVEGPHKGLKDPRKMQRFIQEVIRAGRE